MTGVSRQINFFTKIGTPVPWVEIYTVQRKRIFVNLGSAQCLAACSFPVICRAFVYPGSCPRISHRQARWLGWKTSPKFIWCQNIHTTTRRKWPNFGCHFHYQDNGTRFRHHCTSIAHPIQIACVMLAIARTKVWTTFFEIIIESSYNNKTTTNTTKMAQWPNLSLIYILKFIIYIFPPPHRHHPVPFVLCLHKLVHPSRWFQ